ncbi:hypothetical protein GGS21DRAFT_361570 [Xylaria nigripes]|nr:hypothetical protein GGS21DRAFT_361570 [Xylaria nigripes]
MKGIVISRLIQYKTPYCVVIPLLSGTVRSLTRVPHASNSRRKGLRNKSAASPTFLPACNAHHRCSSSCREMGHKIPHRRICAHVARIPAWLCQLSRYCEDRFSRHGNKNIGQDRLIVDHMTQGSNPRSEAKEIWIAGNHVYPRSLGSFSVEHSTFPKREISQDALRLRTWSYCVAFSIHRGVEHGLNRTTSHGSGVCVVRESVVIGSPSAQDSNLEPMYFQNCDSAHIHDSEDQTCQSTMVPSAWGPAWFSAIRISRRLNSHRRSKVSANRSPGINLMRPIRAYLANNQQSQWYPYALQASWPRC